MNLVWLRHHGLFFFNLAAVIITLLTQDLSYQSEIRTAVSPFADYHRKSPLRDFINRGVFNSIHDNFPIINPVRSDVKGQKQTRKLKVKKNRSKKDCGKKVELACKDK
ncbi:hypothetical protein GQX74_006944 [Glossina fuscipes]|nr:hypothetical protein GQX74_006944 [Glossina fuscipes]